MPKTETVSEVAPKGGAKPLWVGSQVGGDFRRASYAERWRRAKFCVGADTANFKQRRH